MALFTQAEKWYLVSPEATGDWASVVTGWNASNVTFYNLIYKLKAGISHNQALTTNDWESVDITDTVNNTSYSSNLGYWVYVESITSGGGGGNGGGTPSGPSVVLGMNGEETAASNFTIAQPDDAAHRASYIACFTNNDGGTKLFLYTDGYNNDASLTKTGYGAEGIPLELNYSAATGTVDIVFNKKAGSSLFDSTPYLLDVFFAVPDVTNNLSGTGSANALPQENNEPMIAESFGLNNTTNNSSVAHLKNYVVNCTQSGNFQFYSKAIAETSKTLVTGFVLP